MIIKKFLSLIALILIFSSSAFSQEAISTSSGSSLEGNIFAKEFYLSPNKRIQSHVIEQQGLLFTESGSREKKSHYAIVTGFAGGAIRTQQLYGIENQKQIQSLMKEKFETADYEGVEIKKLDIPVAEGKEKTIYFVGQKSFASADEAKASVKSLKTIVESDQDFQKMVSEAQMMMLAPEAPEPIEIKSPAQSAREEEIMLNYLDKLDFGEKIFGPFQGEGTGESVVWQSFGETTWRLTNLEDENYRDQVFFWTNRIVLKGIRFPLNTVDPYIEAIPALDSSGVDFKSNLKLFAGIEWRPLARSAWISNFRPMGLPLLEFMKNYRLYLQYGNRHNLKDEITGSRNHELTSGVSIFYEWGIELPPLDESSPETFADYVSKYIWGEYFGDYRFERTGFSGEDNPNNWIWNSSIILGLKLPGIPLPDNPINEELLFMPYMRFEHVNSTEFSFPYQNRYFVAAGMRWMPFRDYRYKENEWLAKTKIFAEWVGVGKVQNAKDDGEVPYAVDYDLRFGVSFSSRRY